MSTTTDILDTTIPEPAWVLDPTYDSELNPELTHNRESAGRMVSDEGKYVSRASDVERVQYGFDGDPGLLVEAASMTNLVEESADVTATIWNNSSVILSAATSVIKGETAQTATASSSGDSVSQDVGTLSGSDELYSVILESGTSTKVGIGVRNQAAGDFIRDLFTWDGSSSSLTNGDSNTHVREIASSGPNGSKLAEIRIRLKSGDANNTNGDARRVYVYPDRNGNGGDVTIHHVQHVEQTKGGIVIPTGSSPTTRGGDTYKIFTNGQPSWYNEEASTWFAEVVPRWYNNSSTPQILTANGTSGTILYAGTQPDGLNWGANDGTNIANPAVGNPAFKPTKIALSLTPNEMKCSVEGQSKTTDHNGTLLDRNRIDIGKSIFLGNIKSLRYYPTALSTFELNLLTS